jgi:hypothetical protein
MCSKKKHECNRNGVYWMLEINKKVTSLILILFL